jgi:hypothetical protein
MVRSHAIMFDTLTAAQETCTAQRLEIRELKDEILVLKSKDTLDWRHPVAQDLDRELKRARIKHPPCTRERFMVALMEEVGELAKEVLEGGTEERIRAEALQVACVALRVVLDATDKEVA